MAFVAPSSHHWQHLNLSAPEASSRLEQSRSVMSSLLRGTFRKNPSHIFVASSDTVTTYFVRGNSISSMENLCRFTLKEKPSGHSTPGALPTYLLPHLIVQHLNVNYSVNGMWLKSPGVRIS